LASGKCSFSLAPVSLAEFSGETITN
jgi:hypothetical protein